MNTFPSSIFKVLLLASILLSYSQSIGQSNPLATLLPKTINVKNFATPSQTNVFGFKETKTFIVNGTEWPVDILYPNVTDHSGLEIKYIDSYYNRKWARESANKKLRMTYWKGPIGPIYNKLVAVSNSNPCPPGWEIPSQSDYMKLLQTFEHFPDLRKVIFNDEKIGSFLNGGEAKAAYWTKEGYLYYNAKKTFYIGNLSDAACIKCIRKNQIKKKNDHFIYGDYAYIGQTSDGLPNGKGSLMKSDGTMIEGNFVDGVFEGLGKIILSDQTIFSGYFDTGILKRGEAIYDEGSYYLGEFDSYIPNGTGNYYNSDGEVIFGQFKNGLVSGKAKTYNLEDGSLSMVNFKKGRPSGEVAILKKDNSVAYAHYDSNGNLNTESHIKSIAIVEVKRTNDAEIDQIEKKVKIASASFTKKQKIVSEFKKERPQPSTYEEMSSKCHSLDTDKKKYLDKSGIRYESDWGTVFWRESSNTTKEQREKAREAERRRAAEEEARLAKIKSKYGSLNPTYKKQYKGIEISIVYTVDKVGGSYPYDLLPKIENTIDECLLWKEDPNRYNENQLKEFKNKTEALEKELQRVRNQRHKYQVQKRETIERQKNELERDIYKKGELVKDSKELWARKKTVELKEWKSDDRLNWITQFTGYKWEKDSNGKWVDKNAGKSHYMVNTQTGEKMKKEDWIARYPKRKTDPNKGTAIAK